MVVKRWGPCCLVNKLTPWSRVLLEKLTGSAASQEIFGTRRFLAVLTSARHLSLSWANSIQSTQPPPTSWRSILILSSHLHLGLPNGLITSDFPTRTLCTPLPSPICATCVVWLTGNNILEEPILPPPSFQNILMCTNYKLVIRNPDVGLKSDQNTLLKN